MQRAHGKTPGFSTYYLEVPGTYSWLRNCSYNRLTRPLSRFSQDVIASHVELEPSDKYPGGPSWGLLGLKGILTAPCWVFKVELEGLIAHPSMMISCLACYTKTLGDAV